METQNPWYIQISRSVSGFTFEVLPQREWITVRARAWKSNGQRQKHRENRDGQHTVRLFLPSPGLCCWLGGPYILMCPEHSHTRYLIIALSFSRPCDSVWSSPRSTWYFLSRCGTAGGHRFISLNCGGGGRVVRSRERVTVWIWRHASTPRDQWSRVMRSDR